MDGVEWVLYGLACAILLAVGFLLLLKRSQFPETRVGYHVKEAMQNSAAWESCNRTAGKLCMLGAAVFAAVFALLLFLRAERFWALAIYFVLWAVETPVIVLIPAKRFCKKEQHATKHES